MWPAQAPPITRPVTSKLQAPTGTKHPLLNVHVEIWKVTSPISPTKTLVASCILSYAFLLRNIVEVLSDSDLPFPAEHLHERESSRLFPRSSITSLYLLVDMTTAIGVVQRCMVVLAIFLCYFHVQSESVDCEMYPFHHTCRGTMSRKRAMFPTIFSAGCDENKPSLNCIREFEERQRGPYIPLSKSSLLLALLNNNLLKDMTRLTHHKQRNNEMDERTPPLMDSFLSELESSDNY